MCDTYSGSHPHFVCSFAYHNGALFWLRLGPASGVQGGGEAGEGGLRNRLGHLPNEASEQVDTKSDRFDINPLDDYKQVSQILLRS